MMSTKSSQKVPKSNQKGKKCLPLNTITGAVQHGNNILCIMKRSNITMMSSINNGHGLQAQTLHFYKNKSIICNFEKNQKLKKKNTCLWCEYESVIEIVEKYPGFGNW